jgi:hypothetical protein
MAHEHHKKSMKHASTDGDHYSRLYLMVAL